MQTSLARRFCAIESLVAHSCCSTVSRRSRGSWKRWQGGWPIAFRLAECFTQIVGQPPIQYLALWRIQLAARMLSDGGSKVATVGRNVRYESKVAFSRAFKRFVGVPPAQW